MSKKAKRAVKDPQKFLNNYKKETTERHDTRSTALIVATALWNHMSIYEEDVQDEAVSILRDLTQYKYPDSWWLG